MFGWGRSRSNERRYRIYTTDFDEVISSTTLLNRITPLDRPTLEAATAVFRAPSEFRQALEQTIRSMDDLASLSDFHFTFLVDHSGSMKGAHALAAAVIVDVATAYFATRGVKYEVLGYTTRNWHGGLARARWRRRLCLPRPPGRLCELRHIVYGDDKADPVWRDSLGLLFASDVLREGIDGEALRWAEARSADTDRPNRILVQIGDCSPSDASTDEANPRQFLEDDFLATAVRLTSRADLNFGVLTFVPWLVDGFRQFPVRNEPVGMADDVASALASLLAGRNPPAITSLFPQG
jgi:cobaltochelatase CobT